MIAYLYSNTKPFEAELSSENSLKMLSFATNNDTIFEMFLHLRASLVVTSRWPEELGLAELTSSSLPPGPVYQALNCWPTADKETPGSRLGSCSLVRGLMSREWFMMIQKPGFRGSLCNKNCILLRPYSYERVVLVFTSVYVCLFLRRMILFHLESKGPEPAHGPGGGGTLYNNYTGRLRPKRGNLFQAGSNMNR